jgi:hypothetical protein
MHEEFEEQWFGRMWGVYYVDGDEGDPPAALFADKSDALAWLTWQQTTGERDAALHAVIRTDLYASYWNGPEGEDPKGTHFIHFAPENTHA